MDFSLNPSCSLNIWDKDIFQREIRCDAPIIGIYRSLAIKRGGSTLPSLIFFGIVRESEVGENAILGLSRAEMVRNTCFHVKYGLSHLWLALHFRSNIILTKTIIKPMYN